MVDGARGVLNSLLADVYVFTDTASGAASGNSPGYGTVLVAETTSGALVSAEACATQVRGTGFRMRKGCCQSRGRNGDGGRPAAKPARSRDRP
jgi:hypothetical protein